MPALKKLYEGIKGWEKDCWYICLLTRNSIKSNKDHVYKYFSINYSIILSGIGFKSFQLKIPEHIIILQNSHVVLDVTINAHLDSYTGMSVTAEDRFGL